MAAERKPICVALVDDYDVVLIGLAHMFDRYRDRIVVAEIDANQATNDAVDIVLYDSFAQPEADADEIAGLVRNSIIGGVDKALGIVFGIGRGVVVILVAYIATGAFVPDTSIWPEPVRQSRFLPAIADGAAWLNEQLPAQYRPRLPEPPSGRAPTAEELLRPPARNRI